MKLGNVLDASPPVQRGMTDKLDKDAFRKTIEVLAAKVSPRDTGSVLRAPVLKRSILDLPRIQSAAQAPDGDRLVLFRVQSLEELPEDARAFIEEKKLPLTTHKIELTYDYWTVDDIIASVLPENLLEEAPSGFATVGHIAHLNLRDEYLPYKHIIGQLVLDKVGRVRTVVNKLNTIQNKFRVFDMELIAGEPDYLVEHHESDCTFTFDFTKVYWNSRLHTEHGRIIDTFKCEDVVADVFAGVGPFAVPAGKKGCGVFANDLNPESFKYLKLNITKNKVDLLVRPSCEDGKDFIRSVVARVLDDPMPPAAPPMSNAQLRKVKREQRLAKEGQDQQHETRPRPPSPPPAPAQTRTRVTQFVMNLPDTAILFLGAFRGLLSPANVGGRDLSGLYTEMPMVHCYCFTREAELEKAAADIRARVEHELGHSLGEEVSYFHVRSVAPTKEMFCISFRLPREVAFEA
ncbi:Met-10 like-protein-domain-containing protein [Phanerochaete sordida]|uniref:tRNA (guanine(37)-N1)-methyltransferase n=1 Tax=Phanerochaete sordida TaxID=48140 RepID=A0A9P3LBN8_9APHY|nr:Met-10 like-protein-domain-containing protein [Phanerochaete sordida]